MSIWAKDTFMISLDSGIIKLSKLLTVRQVTCVRVILAEKNCQMTLVLGRLAGLSFLFSCQVSE